MFTGAQSAFPEVRTGAKGFTAFPASKSQPIGLPGKRAGDGIIGPQLVPMRGLQNHFFRTSSFFSFAEGLLNQLFIAEAFQRDALGRGRCEAERRLVFEKQGKGRSDMFAGGMARTAFKLQVIAL